MRLSPQLAGLVVLLACQAVAHGAAAQQPACGPDTVINGFRYVLDIEPPESPALVALGATLVHSRSATSPKPVAFSGVATQTGAGRTLRAAAIDVSPFFAVGGGARTLCSYRENSVAGRLKRVGTKTIISLGVLPLEGPARATRFGAAIRATLHDPHDPINNSDLVHAVPPGRADDEQPPDTETARASYADAARAMRARDRWIVSAGYGAANTFTGGTLGETGSDWRHALWLSWQRTLDARFDVLFTGEGAWQRGEGPGYRVVSAVRRKYGAGDGLAELAFDTGDERLHAGASAEARLAPRIRAALGVRTEPGPEPGDARVLRAGVTLRWTAGY